MASIVRTDDGVADASDSDAGDPAIDSAAFARRVRELGVELRRQASDDDLVHLRRIERWGRACMIAGYGTAWIAPNPISPVLMAQAQSTRWMLMHHVGHKGYDRVPGIPDRLTSAVFAKGNRRFIDWLDWIRPDAWHVEHDQAHHYHLGEDGDPDVLERNTEFIRKLPLPRSAQALFFSFFACTWRWIYYAPKTMTVLQDKRNAKEPGASLSRSSGAALNPLSADGRETIMTSLLPYAAVQFALIPLMVFPFSRRAARNMLLSGIAADVLANLHGFLVITPSHTAEDLVRFDSPADKPGEFYVRQVLGSANYRTGGDLLDWAHLWLNYQIEHHLWPDLPMLRYRQAQPKVQQLCEEFGLPYRQESVFSRMKKTLRILFGDASMPRSD